MKTSAQKWGNIVLKPRLRRDFRLESLLKGITKRNVHEAVEFGPPVGRELL